MPLIVAHRKYSTAQPRALVREHVPAGARIDRVAELVLRLRAYQGVGTGVGGAGAPWTMDGFSAAHRCAIARNAQVENQGR